MFPIMQGSGGSCHGRNRARKNAVGGQPRTAAPDDDGRSRAEGIGGMNSGMVLIGWFGRGDGVCVTVTTGNAWRSCAKLRESRQVAPAPVVGKIHVTQNLGYRRPAEPHRPSRLQLHQSAEISRRPVIHGIGRQCTAGQRGVRAAIRYRRRRTPLGSGYV